MADNASDRAGKPGLPVGESYRRDLTFEVEVTRRNPALYEVKDVGSGVYANGTSEEDAIAFYMSAKAAWLLNESQQRLREEAEKSQDGTRQIYGDDVTSEQLRDMYLGESPTNPTEGGQ